MARKPKSDEAAEETVESQVEVIETDSDERLGDQPNLEPGERQRLISTYGVEFLLDNVVNTGDVLTEQFAKFFNIQYHNFMVKSFAKTLKTMKDENKSWDEINAGFQQHCFDYEWRPRGDGTSLDPIEREMFTLARQIVNARLSKDGKQTLNAAVRGKTLTPDQVADYLEGVVKENYETLRNKVLQRRAEAASLGDSLSFS